MRVLLLRMAPTWYCCTQPRAWSRRARRWRRAERKTRASAASSALPARSRANSPAATSSVNGTASIVSRPWSEARQPRSWKNVCRFSRAARSASQVPIETPAAFSSFPSHARPGREVLDEHGLVRPPGREDLRVGVLPLREPRVGLERVRGVVGAADDRHAELLQEAHRREAVLLAAARWPGRRSPGRWRGEERLDAERPAQLHVRPVVERVAEGVRAPCGPRPRTSPSRRRRRCRSARPPRSCASPATCSGRPRARPR